MAIATNQAGKNDPEDKRQGGYLGADEETARRALVYPATFPGQGNRDQVSGRLNAQKGQNVLGTEAEPVPHPTYWRAHQTKQDAMTIEAAHKVAWEPQEGPQKLFIQCPAFECLYGGAVGGGKTDALLGDFARGLGQGSKWRGVFIRRFFTDMDDVIHRSMEIFGPVFGEKCYSGSKYQWNFPGGEVLQFRGLEKDMDVYKFQSKAWSWIGWDELTQWASPFPYTYLMTRLRSAKGAKVRVRAATNPGGVGHSWVKARFVDPAPPGTGHKVMTKSGDMYYRVFIPSKLEDNRILMDNDPQYADRIYELNDPMLARALREGDWNIIAGAAIPEWDPKIHVIDPAPIPSDKPIWRSMDWGYVEPYCCGWLFPDNDGNVILAHELYGWSGQPNVGTQESPGEVRAKIESFESLFELYVPMGLLDSQCWDQQGHPTMIAKELGGRELGWKAWPKGPHSRVQQKQIMHQYLAIVNGKSRLKVMRNCTHTIRTLPILPRDKNNIEDVDTNSEDHPYDMLRGGLTKKVPSREQIKKRFLNRRMENTGFITAAELRGGGF